MGTTILILEYTAILYYIVLLIYSLVCHLSYPTFPSPVAPCTDCSWGKKGNARSDSFSSYSLLWLVACTKPWHPLRWALEVYFLLTSVSCCLREAMGPTDPSSRVVLTFWFLCLLACVKPWGPLIEAIKFTCNILDTKPCCLSEDLQALEKAHLLLVLMVLCLDAWVKLWS